MPRSRLLAVLFISVIAFLSAHKQAQAEPRHLTVVGDSIATGLYFGLRDAKGKNKSVTVVRHTRGATGLAAQGHYDWLAAARRIKRIDRPRFVVIAMGGNDRQDIIKGGKRLRRFTKGWWIEYTRRVDRFMQTLAAGRTRAYWVGLPTVRHEKMSRDYTKLNAVYERLARKHGITFIDIYALTAVAGGSLSPKPLRKADGIHFTSFGNYTLGRIILRTIDDSLRISG